MVRIGRGVCEAVIDPGSARTLIYLDTALGMKLPVELANEHINYGSYWGPSGPTTKYAGRIKYRGLKIEFGPGLYI